MKIDTYSFIFSSLSLTLALCIWGFAYAQDPLNGIDPAGDEFTFVRVQYDNAGGHWEDDFGFWGGRRGPAPPGRPGGPGAGTIRLLTSIFSGELNG
jgi:hypothetical protein